jgi:hypothetical protein
MTNRKTKRPIAYPVETTMTEHSFFLEPAQVEIGSGYTLKINYDENEGAVLDIKTYGQVDTTWLRHELKRTFPKIHVHRLRQAIPGTVSKVTKQAQVTHKKDC